MYFDWITKKDNTSDNQVDGVQICRQNWIKKKLKRENLEKNFQLICGNIENIEKALLSARN